ncbi:MAG: excinuclease ABC subunit UvrC [SAR202 cluster bacterium]|nr:excinuclease ABC subunit UvrC [SAR202 cluster bacterium]
MVPNDVLKQRLAAIPEEPGVYLFRDQSARFLYVGKSNSLRPRVRSYFGNQSNLPPKIQRMIQNAADFEFVVTDSETEALILENTLIKRHRPPYNTRLLDDKTYPYIKIDLSQPFPLVSLTRRVLNDEARYFGPFASALSVRRTLDLLKKLFPYRSCTKVITGKDQRPCLEYFINRCIAPCAGYASESEYQTVIQQVVLFLEGRTGSVIRQLRHRMKEASRELAYERAALLRDQIEAINRVNEEQKVFSTKPEDMDVIASAEGNMEACVQVFFIRGGKLIGRDQFTMVGTEWDCKTHILSRFLGQFYERASFIPPVILVQEELDDPRLIEAVLTEKRGARVKLRVPTRGKRRRLLEMVAENALQGLKIAQIKRISQKGSPIKTLEALQEALHLPRLPRRIECYDISNIQGQDPVGSMIVLVDGLPKKTHYRRFKVRGVESIDDYAMMREVLIRRFTRFNHGRKESEPSENSQTSRQLAWEILPDVVLIDGGKGHLNAAHQALLELGVTDDKVPLISIAKRNEELFVVDDPDPIVLNDDDPALFLLQRARDEAHRFAIGYHRKLRSRRSTKSRLDDIRGIGPNKKKALISHFGSIEGIRKASEAEIERVPGITPEMATRIKDWITDEP